MKIRGKCQTVQTPHYSRHVVYFDHCLLEQDTYFLMPHCQWRGVYYAPDLHTGFLTTANKETDEEELT